MKTGKMPVLRLLLCAIFLILILLLLAGIERFVTESQAALEEIALDCLDGNQAVEWYGGVRVEGVFPGEHRIVQFCSGGLGLPPSSAYWGFYYSEDGVPAAYQNVDIPLTPAGEGQWSWSDGTDNGGVTRRITEHWFSYRAWF